MENVAIITPHNTLPWSPLGPGVEMQIYNANEANGCWSTKIHMHPGSTLQDHEHIGASEFYVVEGEGFHPQAGAFKTGDYAYEEKGALHTDVSVDDHLYWGFIRSSGYHYSADC